VLIVDDNATNSMVAEALCEMFDCTSEQAVDGL
jgi:CheY-like chemotaxis protein